MHGKDSGVELLLQLYSTTESAEEKQEQRQVLRARLFQKGQVVYIRYVEELEGVGSVSTTVKVEKEKEQVTIIRRGALEMKHVYCLGKKTKSIYYSPHGFFEMEAETTQLIFQPAVHLASYAQLNLTYNLLLQEQPVGQMTFEWRLQRMCSSWLF